MPNRSRIVVTSEIDSWADDLERQGLTGLQAAGKIAQAGIRAGMTRRGPAGKGVTPNLHVQDSLTVSPTMKRYGGRGGAEVWVYSADPNALWQDQGTRGRKGRAKTARTRERRRAAGISHGGVKPLRYFMRGLRSSWPAGERALAAAIGRARPARRV